MSKKSPREAWEKLKKKLGKKSEDVDALAEIEELVRKREDDFRITVWINDEYVLFEDEAEALTYIEENGGTMSVTRMK